MLSRAHDRARAPACRSGRECACAGRGGYAGGSPPPSRVDPRAAADQARVLRAPRDGEGAEAPHRLRERELPEHRRVLDPPRADDHDPRRHLHALVPVLRCHDRPPAARRSRRASPRRRDARPAAARAHGDHVRRSRRPRRLRRRALGRDDPPREGSVPGDDARDPRRRLQGQDRARRHRPRGRPRRVRAQPRDRPAALAAGPRPGELSAQLQDPRARAPARRGHEDRPRCSASARRSTRFAT